MSKTSYKEYEIFFNFIIWLDKTFAYMLLAGTNENVKKKGVLSLTRTTLLISYL